MTTASVLSREKIVSLSELQRNPGKALDADIVRIMNHSTTVGIFMSLEEFEDFMEEYLPLKESFKKELDTVIRKSKKEKRIPLEDIL